MSEHLHERRPPPAQQRPDARVSSETRFRAMRQVMDACRLMQIWVASISLSLLAMVIVFVYWRINADNNAILADASTTGVALLYQFNTQEQSLIILQQNIRALMNCLNNNLTCCGSNEDLCYASMTCVPKGQCCNSTDLCWHNGACVPLDECCDDDVEELCGTYNPPVCVPKGHC